MQAMKLHYHILAGALCIAATACTTTGDPTSGGIFWSPTKAQMRQEELLSANQALQGELKRETNKTGKLIARRDRLRAQIEAKKAELRRTSDPAKANNISNEIAYLENLLSTL